MLRSTLGALTVASVVVGGVACKRPAEQQVGMGTNLLAMSTSGETPIAGVTSTEAVFAYLQQANQLNEAALPGAMPQGNTGFGLQNQQVYGNDAGALAKVDGRSIIISFGHGKQASAFIRGTVVPCASMPGVIAQMRWRPGERCVKPDGVGLTQQLALLSCGGINSEYQGASCLSVDRMLELMNGTYFKHRSGFGLQNAAVGPEGDADQFYNVRLSRAPSMTADFADGNETFHNVSIARYGIGGLGLNQPGGLDDAIEVVTGEDGIIGASLYVGGQDAGSASANGITVGPDGVVLNQPQGNPQPNGGNDPQAQPQNGAYPQEGDNTIGFDPNAPSSGGYEDSSFALDDGGMDGLSLNTLFLIK